MRQFSHGGARLKHIDGTIDWAAGFMEGEASFTFGASYSPVVAVGQKRGRNRWSLRRLQKMFGGCVYIYKNSHLDTWQVRGLQALFVMSKVYPLLSPWRKKQVRQVLQRASKWRPGGWGRPPKSFRNPRSKLTPSQVRRIRVDGFLRPAREVAKEYHVSPSLIQQIAQRKVQARV